MPRVPVHGVADAPPESQETLEALGKRVGKVINLFGEIVHAPVLLKMYAATEGLLREESSFGEATRQAIHLAVAHSNDCGYCQAAYTGAAKAAGLSEETTKDTRRAAVPDDEKLTTLLTSPARSPPTPATSPTRPGPPRSTPAGPSANSSRATPRWFAPS